VFDRAVSAIKAAKAKGLPSTSMPRSSTDTPRRHRQVPRLHEGTRGRRFNVAGYAYERAPDQEHFLNRTKTKKRSATCSRSARQEVEFHAFRPVPDFLAGNQTYECTPWGMPARNISAGRSPAICSAKLHQDLQGTDETTDWETYGTGKYEKCADCMAHCGYEPTAANAAFANPLKAMWVALRGVRTTGPMAPEISLDQQRPAQYIFSAEVQKRLSDIRRDEALAAGRKEESLDSRVGSSARD